MLKRYRLDAWRTPYSGAKGEADLHIDVVFNEGRIGGRDTDAPVRFRLSLKKAEVHVNRDSIDVLKIPPSSIAREKESEGVQKTVAKTKKSAGADGSLNVNPTAIVAKGNLKAEASVELTKQYEQTEVRRRMKVTHRRTERGYAFDIEPTDSNRLDGQPWDVDEARMKLQDTKHDRKRGEPPVPVIEIHCRREDLIIEDIQYTDEKEFSWSLLSLRKKSQ